MKVAWGLDKVEVTHHRLMRVATKVAPKAVGAPQVVKALVKLVKQDAKPVARLIVKRIVKQNQKQIEDQITLAP